MIKILTEFSDIRGALPLVSVIQTDFKFFGNDADGVFCQETDGEISLVLSIRGATATICKISDNIDIDELVSFLEFRQVSNILSDFYFDGFQLEARSVLKAISECSRCENVISLTPESRLGDYQRVFELLSHNGEFQVWYPNFSKKVNNSCAYGTYLMENNVPVSCALAPFVVDKIGIVAGVFTNENCRKKGYATKCTETLLSDLKTNGIEEIYLWCEDKNLNLYENIGFSVCGKIYVKREV
jgi:N-acetylglutamate synthase-like GNAT family acetyltransferase